MNNFYSPNHITLMGPIGLLTAVMVHLGIRVPSFCRRRLLTGPLLLLMLRLEVIVSLADDRSRREPWFNTCDDTLTPSRNASLGVSPSLGLYGNSIGGQLPQSPYPGTSPLASRQTACLLSSNQSPHLTYRSHTSNVGPRLTQSLFTQQSSNSCHTYQSVPPVIAWSQPPSGHIVLAREAAPRPL
ncbi:uncharacterized protein EI90DRAFT_1988966 [Cantharellus anzutake]|uniref:uncharacterized protein n=1 Tax=Cantharellus anzutake TaxID=1750568 RepID=UPI0019060905|nr:uncharacterized protein EI90DRAFT_1988966 [Cantharellus anzutake]KAF8326041.1 hypothetical protein EI90DRAFT_1988966 [Cantharellus anzutake]